MSLLSNSLTNPLLRVYLICRIKHINFRVYNLNNYIPLAFEIIVVSTLDNIK